MAKGEVAGSFINGGGGGRFRLRPVFSAAAFRRKLLEAVVCGGGSISILRTGVGSRPATPETDLKRRERSGRLAELLKAEISESERPAGESENEAKRKAQLFEELGSVVKKLQQEDSRKEAAMEVRRLAKDNAEARETLAMYGAIPPLAGSIDAVDPELQIESLYALLNLGIGNSANKAAIVKSGSAHKMLKLTESGCSRQVSEAIVANLLGLSALDSNKAVIGGASGAILFLVMAFRSAEPKSQARLDSLRSLLNLSTSPINVQCLVESGMVPCLLAAIGDMEVTDKALSVVSNIVWSPEGRRAVSRSPESIPILVDVLTWCDSPECQEKAAYIVMIMAYKSYNDRAAMIQAGLVSALLELTLMGSALAQKRASRILEIIRMNSMDKGKPISEGLAVGSNNGGVGPGSLPVSAPLCLGLPEEDDDGLELGMGVKELVRQSLQNNMMMIVKRAKLPQDFVPSDWILEVTGSSATTKSLPF